MQAERARAAAPAAADAARDEQLRQVISMRKESSVASQALVDRAQRELAEAQAQLDDERQAVAEKAARLDDREAEVLEREAEAATRQTQLTQYSEELEDFAAEGRWEQWRERSMGKLMNELLRRVPRDEWRQRMQRAMTTLSVYQRENLRLRAELHSGAPPTQADVSDGMLELHEGLEARAVQAEEALRR